MSRFDIRPEGAPLFLHIAAGVAIGVLVAAGVIWMCWLLQLRLVADEAAKQAQQAAARIHAEQQRQAEDAQAREQQRRTTEAAAAVSGFFNVQAGGSCPTWTTAIPFLKGEAKLDHLCTPLGLDALAALKVCVLLVASFFAFRIAVE